LSCAGGHQRGSRVSIIGRFRDPKTRPRAIVWLGMAIIGLAVFFVAVGVIGTSTKWFCANPCHMVQSDTIASNEASVHANISCVACHEPANASPIVLVMAKVRSVGEVPPTVTGTYELPLNALSAYALNTHEMGSEQCTQCHSGKRKITPSPGIIIDHEAHEKEGVTCTTCHNRVAHNDAGIKMTLAGNRPHTDFMKMDACFRCHDLAGQRRAGGECKLCHPADFKLVPETHEEKGWLPNGHAEAAVESLKEFGAATVEAEDLVREGVSEDVAVPVEYCSTCHKKAFCDECHDKLAAGLKPAPAK